MRIMRQRELLGLCQSSLYYHPKPVSQVHVALMRRIDELHLKYPLRRARRLARMLQREGTLVGRRHVGTLMQRMGLEAIYRTRRTCIPDKGHKIYPCLLGTVALERPNQVWAADITYLPMATGFLWLVAILGLATRKVLGFRVNNAMSTACVEALEEALTGYGAPEIFNTDQGSQFTAEDFTQPLEARGVRVSMDGNGHWVNNVFVERLWRSVKYEEVFLYTYDSPREANAALERHLQFYNGRRPHQALDDRTPDEAYFTINEMRQMA